MTSNVQFLGDSLKFRGWTQTFGLYCISFIIHMQVSIYVGGVVKRNRERERAKKKIGIKRYTRYFRDFKNLNILISWDKK